MVSNTKYLFHICILLVGLFSTAQTSLVDQFHEMQLNPLLKEKVYVHTNKTSYFSDDVIWFKAYVGDSLNYPSLRTRVLEVRLFDDKGVQIFNRTVAISSGAGHGQIALNDAVAPGTYYLQARTNYMKNFGEDYHYLQKITILGQEPPARVQDGQVKYDVQLLPESGNLIEDVENFLGVKATLNGKGVDFQGTIFNSKGDMITTFQSEYQGMGKCSFLYKKNEKYKAKIKIQDTLFEQALPTAIAKGVSLSLDNSDEEYLKIRLKTNEATIKNQTHSNYTLLYRQDRQLFQLVSIAGLNSTNGLLKTSKDIFLDGVHTVTLFADDRPVAERKFYIETDRKKAFVSLEKSKIDSDSITYRIVPEGIRENPDLNLSVSILPGTSKAARMKNTIESAFLLNPYVRGPIENPAYYFNKANKKRKDHLDLLLLTQGWTGYTLYEIIETINPSEEYEFETGFELRGTIQEEIKHNNLVLIPEDYRVIDKVDLQGKFEFAFQDLSVFKGDTVRVAYQNPLGKIIKPSQILYDTIQKESVSALAIPKVQSVSKIKKDSEQFSNKTGGYGVDGWEDDPQFKNLDGTIDLDEVIVTERKRSEGYLRRRKVIEKYKPIVSDIGKYYDVPIPEVFNNSSIDLMDFLAHRGFSVQTSSNGQSYLGGFRKLAYLFVNGRPIAPEQLPTWQLPMENIENIMVNNLGFDPGPQVSKMIFSVFTSDAFGQEKNTLFDKFVIKNGFDRAKKYYTPMYAFEESRPLDLMEVDWKPNLKRDGNGNINFKIAKDQKVDDLLFIIQGFSNEGHLISQRIPVD